MSFSVDEAVALLDAPPAGPTDTDQGSDHTNVHNADPAPSGDEADVDDEIAEGDATPNADAEGALEGQPESEDGEDEPAAPAVEAPKFWRADQRLKFAQLPREVQELIAETQPEASKGGCKANPGRGGGEEGL